MGEPGEGIRRLADLMLDSRHTVVLTGAGVSTESGIPDFRSPGTGLWQKRDPMKYATVEALMERPEIFYGDSLPRLLGYTNARPNRAHYVLARLEQEGLIRAVITQNVDNLHFAAGSVNVLEVHGHMRTGRCLGCRREVAMSLLVEKVQAGQVPPRCDGCGSILRPNVVLFGDPMAECFGEAERLAMQSDLMLVVGSSLMVAPVNYLPAMSRKLAIVNLQETPYDGRAEVVIREKAGMALDLLWEEICHRRRPADH